MSDHRDAHTHGQTLNHTHLLTLPVIVAPSISYYLFLWLAIDQLCSGWSCAGYDVLYYLCISVRHADLGGGD